MNELFKQSNKEEIGSMVVQDLGTSKKITTLDSEFLIKKEAITAVETLTRNDEETYELLAYLKQRISTQEGLHIANGYKYYGVQFSPKVIKILCEELDNLNVGYDQVIAALDVYSDYELFGEPAIIEPNDKNGYIVNKIKDIVIKVAEALEMKNNEYITEEEIYENTDDSYKYYEKSKSTFDYDQEDEEEYSSELDDEEAPVRK